MQTFKTIDRATLGGGGELGKPTDLYVGISPRYMGVSTTYNSADPSTIPSFVGGRLQLPPNRAIRVPSLVYLWAVLRAWSELFSSLSSFRLGMPPDRSGKLHSQKSWHRPEAANKMKTQVVLLLLQPCQLGLEKLRMLRGSANHHTFCGSQVPSPTPNPTLPPYIYLSQDILQLRS